MTSAIDIHQEFLDALTPRLLTGDIEDFLPRFILPFRIRTNDKSGTCRTLEELRDQVEQYCMHLKETGVTALRRTVEDAKFVSPDRTEGFHVTEIVRDGKALIKPYPTRMRLRRLSGLWCAEDTDSVVSNADWRLVSELQERGTTATDPKDSET